MNNYCEFEKNTKNIDKDIKTEKITNDISISRVSIKTKEESISFKKNLGLYSTIYCKNYDYLSNKMFSKITSVLINEIKLYLKNLKINLDCAQKIFIVGLGNSEIPADKLGFLVSKKIISTSNLIKNKLLSAKYFSNVFSIAPSVSSINGIDTSTIIKSITKELKPTLVVLVDSMTCKNYKYMGNAIQLSSSGFTPGGEMSNNKTLIDKKFLNCPVLTIGCPLVIDLKNLIKTKEKLNFLSSKDITFQVRSFANVISYSLNKVLHNKLKRDEIIYLTKEF